MDQDAVDSKALGGMAPLDLGQFTAADILLLDGLGSGIKVAPGAIHHVFGMGQFVVEVLNRRIFDRFLSPDAAMASI